MKRTTTQLLAELDERHSATVERVLLQIHDVRETPDFLNDIQESVVEAFRRCGESPSSAALHHLTQMCLRIHEKDSAEVAIATAWTAQHLVPDDAPPPSPKAKA